MIEHNITIELNQRNPTLDDIDVLMDAFGDFHPTIGTSAYGWVEVDVTVPGENLRQAIAIGLALAGDVRSITGMTTAEYDRRPTQVERMPQLLSAPDVAERLGISRQAVLTRIERGTLPATKVGREWVIPDTALPPSPTMHTVCGHCGKRITLILGDPGAGWEHDEPGQIHQAAPSAEIPKEGTDE
jgi:excisionase family DNA binding protein